MNWFVSCFIMVGIRVNTGLMMVNDGRYSIIMFHSNWEVIRDGWYVDIPLVVFCGFPAQNDHKFVMFGGTPFINIIRDM